MTDVTPASERRIQGEGLPFPKDPSKHGDLIVQFDIQFPDNLSRDKREKIGALLPATRL